MKIGFIDYFLDEPHSNTCPAELEKISGGEVKLAYAYAMIDSPKEGGLTTDEWCEKFGAKRCHTMEELVELSDAIMVMAPDYPEQHEELCRVALASGKPCYVDKTFVQDKETAARIFKYAEEHNTPCYSASGLRFAPTLKGIETSNIKGVSSWGPAWGGGLGYEIYAIHQIEPVMMLMNAEPESVMILPSENLWYTMLIKFKDSRVASVSGFTEGCSPFMLNIATDKNCQVVDYSRDYYAEFIKELIDFFHTGEEKVPHQSTIDIIAVLTAGLKALDCPGEWVEV